MLRTGTVRGPLCVGPRTVPVRSAWPGTKARTFCSPPQRADMLRTGTVRGPGAVSMRTAEVFQLLQARTKESILIFSLIPDYSFQQRAPQVGFPERLWVPARTRFAKRGAGEDKRPSRAEGLGHDERVLASPRQD